MEGEEETCGFPAHLFPASFTLLYCSFPDCSKETPFTDPMSLLAHIAESHNIQVENPSAVIPFLDRYLSSLLTHPEEEDATRRQRLQHQRLQEILSIQAAERPHTKARHCLFCPTHMPTNELFTHMFHTHGFNIGQLDNLVMVGEFLDILQGKLDHNICIYCEKTFPSGAVLRKHIKNKGHYRIHPSNHIYDRFYVVNYVRVGKLWDEEAAAKEKDERSEEGEEEWSELIDPIDERTSCLFCSQITVDPEECIRHMEREHDFRWDEIRKLDTYEAIKVINYLRVRITDLACIHCEVEFEEESHLLEHLKTHKNEIPSRHLWDDPRFLFPIYDDDPLLCHLDEW